MYFSLKADLKFYSVSDEESLSTRIKFLQRSNYQSSKIWFWPKREDRYTILPQKNGFELNDSLSTSKGMEIVANGIFKTSAKGTEISIKVRPVKWSLWLYLLLMTGMSILVVYCFWHLCGAISLFFIPIPYLFIAFIFTVKVWDVENVVIHKICEERAHKI